MGRKLKDLKQLKMSKGQTSPVRLCPSPESSPCPLSTQPSLKKNRRVPPLRIRIKPANQLHSSPKVDLKPKSKKAIILNERILPLNLVDLTTKRKPVSPPPNAWSKPLLQKSCPQKLSVSDDDLSDTLVIDDDVDDEIYQSDFNYSPTPYPSIGEVNLPPVLPVRPEEPVLKDVDQVAVVTSPTVQYCSTESKGEKEKNPGKEIAWDLTIMDCERKRSAQSPTMNSNTKTPKIQLNPVPPTSPVSPPGPTSCPKRILAPPNTPTDISPTLQLLKDAANPYPLTPQAGSSGMKNPHPGNGKIPIVQLGKLAPTMDRKNEQVPSFTLPGSMKLLENLGKLPGTADNPVQQLHQATSSAFGRLNDQIQSLSYQLQAIQKQPVAPPPLDNKPSFVSEYIPHVTHQVPWATEKVSKNLSSPTTWAAAPPSRNISTTWTSTTTRIPASVPTVPGWHQSFVPTTPTSSWNYFQPQSPQVLPSTSPQYRRGLLLDHSKAQWSNIQQDRILQAQDSGPKGISLPKLFERQYEIAPELKAFGRNHSLASWTLSLQETRRADVIYSFTVRLTAVLLEAFRKSPDFCHLQGLDNLDWDVQKTFLARVLQPFMKVRSLAGLVSYFTSTYGKEDHLTKTMFEIWAQFQLSKLSHPFCPNSQDHTHYQPHITEALLTFPKTTTNMDNDYFSPLPALPAREKLWFTLTHRLECGRTPIEAIAFLTWVSIHDQHLGRALVAPLFELGHFTHTWAYTFEPHHICMAPASPQIETPQVVRILRICSMFIASKILQVTLTNKYPTGINQSGQVFLPLSKKEASKQTLASDLLLNKEHIQFTGSSFDSTFTIHNFHFQVGQRQLGRRYLGPRMELTFSMINSQT